MSETYKCKKCSAEFPKTPEGLKEYRAHNLHCEGTLEDQIEETAEELAELLEQAKAEAEKAESEKEESEKAEEPQPKKVQETVAKAKARNTCRGYYEGNKDEICKQFNRCSDCWADFENKLKG